MDIYSDRLRGHVENRYRDQIPAQWGPTRRESYLDDRVTELRAQVEQRTRELAEYHIGRFRSDFGREASEQERLGLINNSRLEAMEIAVRDLYDDFDEDYDGGVETEPSQADLEEMIGQRLEAQWTALPPMQRWMTPWSEDPDDDLITLAWTLWKGHDNATRIAGAHLLHARRSADLPIPHGPEDPIMEAVHSELMTGIADERRRQQNSRTTPHPS